MKRRDPFEALERVFEGMVTRRNNPRVERQVLENTSMFRDINVDVADYEDEIVVTADVPGYNSEDINVTLNRHGTLLTITAESTSESDTEENKQYIRSERTHSKVRRQIKLPTRVDVNSASSSYVNGVLSITLEKDDSDESHGIQIDVTSDE